MLRPGLWTRSRRKLHWNIQVCAKLPADSTLSALTELVLTEVGRRRGRRLPIRPEAKGGEDWAPNGTFRVGALCRHFRHYFTFGQAQAALALAVVGVSAFLGMPRIAILDWGVPWLRCGPCEARDMRRGRFSTWRGILIQGERQRTGWSGMAADNRNLQSAHSRDKTGDLPPGLAVIYTKYLN